VARPFNRLPVNRTQLGSLIVSGIVQMVHAGSLCVCTRWFATDGVSWSSLDHHLIRSTGTMTCYHNMAGRSIRPLCVSGIVQMVHAGSLCVCTHWFATDGVSWSSLDHHLIRSVQGPWHVTITWRVDQSGHAEERAGRWMICCPATRCGLSTWQNWVSIPGDGHIIRNSFPRSHQQLQHLGNSLRSHLDP